MSLNKVISNHHFVSNKKLNYIICKYLEASDKIGYFRN